MDLLPSTVYSPLPTHEQVSAGKPNTVIEEQRRSSLARRKRVSTVRRSRAMTDENNVSPLEEDFLTPRANQFPVPRARSISPTSSLDSAPVSWSTRSDGAGTDATASDYDDLYDVSDDEVERSRRVAKAVSVKAKTGYAGELGYGSKEGDIPIVCIRRMESVANQENSNYDALHGDDRKRVLSLDIPSEAARIASHKMGLMAPTPPPKIPISPAVLSLLTRDVSTSTAPPSLDGSSMSEVAADSTAPTTPTMEASEAKSRSWDDDGIHLNREALATLQSLSEGEVQEHVEPMVEIPSSRAQRPREVRQDSDDTIQPPPRLSDLSDLEIPSPGGFFSSLNNTARHTWAPPSSTTAEHFYKAPWNLPEPSRPRLVEQVIEAPPASMSDTATPSLETPRALVTPAPVEDNIVTTTIDFEYDPDYERNLKLTASASLDRTSSWLQTQTQFLEDLRDAINPGIFGGGAIPSSIKSSFGTLKRSHTTATAGKKSVQFLDDVQQLVDKAETQGVESQDAVFWRAFQEMIHISNLRDALVYSKPRFDALQIKRVCAPAQHCDQLMGNYTTNKVAITQDPEDQALLTVREPAEPEKMRDAEDQMKASAWNVTAAKILNGGNLLISPAAKRIRGGKATRILDLGGQSVCDWAWHCAEEFPRSDVYTVVKEDARQDAYSNLRGPANHRQVTVSQLYYLPFPDHFFEVISARTLYTLLKTNAAEGKDGGSATKAQDEYDLCLKECLRCLKPGGYLEFSMLDSDIMNAGPLGTTMSVEFGLSLRTRGYDSSPTRSFLGRLKRAGFKDLKRSWIVLPMGTNPALKKAAPPPAAADDGAISSQDVMTGSTADAACLSCLVGSLAWEKWMLKLQMESGRDGDRLLEGVSAVVQEGRGCGAAWRCLSGWARKPLSLETNL